MANINIAIADDWKEDTFKSANEFAGHCYDWLFSAAYVHKTGVVEICWEYYNYDHSGMDSIETWLPVSKKWKQWAKSSKMGVLSIYPIRRDVKIPYNLILGRDGDEVLSLILGG